MVTWKFTRGTIVAHAVLDESKGTTYCNRTGLKFEPSVPEQIGTFPAEKYRCVTCTKTLKKLASQAPCKEGST